MNRCVPQRLFTSCPHLQALLLPNEVGQTWPMPAHDGRVSLLLRGPRPARDRSQRENESLSSFCRGFLKQVMGSFAPASPPLDMQDEAAGPQNPPWLQGPAGSKNGTPPCGFDDERIYCRHEAAGTGQNGTGQRGQNGRSGTRQRGRNGRSCTRQSGQNGRSGVSAAGSGDNGANGRKRTNSRVRAVNGNAPDRPG